MAKKEHSSARNTSSTGKRAPAPEELAPSPSAEMQSLAEKGPYFAVDQPAIDLPDYIVRRNEQALAAGLQIQKQSLRATGDGTLTTWYVGPEHAWRASKFVPEGFVFPPKISLKAAVWAPTHWMRKRFPITRQVDGTFRGSITGESLPEHTQAVGDGIMAYEFRLRSQHYIAYHGPARVMIARGIAPPGVENGSSGPRGAGVSMWRSFIEGDGLLLIKDLIAIEEDRKAKEVSQALCEEIESARVLVRSSAAKGVVRPFPHDPAFKRFLSAAMGDR